ncbi:MULTISPECIES: efflux RND transporter permease subunit [unclassified Halomonas]|uniref:efflux RND transporter permease subunit n=1 Tax=unclassified Halomonas TaxID=2609666 RepID=UPI001EF501D4|nr:MULTISPECIES: efflux RND transporter permease subunit [unclassified Halomonas]MCG7578051.1 efflux RND transporter permease subunit [Halomonas sp. MMH1-48]MCG7605167.1 efflux RND transporter permease subunit [Halomonas sp. MM17-34]MCG7614339.1 efflux RND transporter permease subunit [Halomonas sp. MM17-29]MCG7621241.1 efflux RND transporter permease subunit [Halomonas sp. DSH1-27]
MRIEWLFNRRLLALILGLLVVSGLSAIQTLPRAEDPHLVARMATVLAPFPGATPEQIEALVARPIEDELRTISEIHVLESTSRQGIALLSVELGDEVTDVTPVWSRVRDKLGDVAPSLPEGVQTPELLDDRGYAFSLVAALRWTLDTPPSPPVMERYAERLEDAFRQVAGTEYTHRFGVAGEQVEVVVDPMELNALGLSVGQLAATIEASDGRRTAGEVVTQGHRLTVGLSGEFDALDRLREINVTTRQGQSVKLGEIAELRRGVQDPPNAVALLDGERAVYVGARMAPGQRIDLWVARAQERLADFADELPVGLAVEEVFEQASYTNQRLSDVALSLLMGLVLVVAILFLTMGWRSALTVGLAIPATALLTLALFRPLGMEIHQMSIIGIIVALGLMVDNAIVMTNALRERFLQGDSALAATRDALRHLAVPLLASTLTTILAFMPIVLMPGPAGEFVGPLAMAVMVALVSSYLVSLFLVPALSPMLLAKVAAKPPAPRDHSLKRAFRGTVRSALRHPVAAMVITLCVPVGGIALMPTLDVAFFPPADRDQFHIEVRLPAASSIAQTQALAHEMEHMVREVPGVLRVSAFIGESAPMMYYNVLTNEDNNPAFLHLIVDTESLDVTNRQVPPLQQALDRRFPQAQSVVRKYEQGPPFKAPIELRVYGNDLNVLSSLGLELAGLMHQLPQVTHVRAGMQRDLPRLMLDIDQTALNNVGLSPQNLAEQVGAALSGQPAGVLLEDTQQLPVRVRYADDWRTDAEQLAALRLVSEHASEGLPLAAVADSGLVPSWSVITRRNAERVQLVQGYLVADALPAISMAQLETKLQAAIDSGQIRLPPGYRIETGGEAAERDEAVSQLLASVVLLVIAMLATVVLAFNSFRRAAIVFIAGAQAMGMGIVALLLSGHAFGFVIIVGIMGLVGVAINATIIIIAAFDDDPAARQGDSEAMLAVISGPTSRHIVSTTITTFAGLIPLMVAAGGLWPPFAQTVGFGLLLATLVSFFFTPALYRLWVARAA